MPLQCLPERKKNNIKEILKIGLNTIIKKAGKKSIMGKYSISIKKQDELGIINFLLTLKEWHFKK